jgi:Sedlin, N-terminal conserved region
MIHSSLDRLEEMLGSPKKGSMSIGRFQRGSHWLGCICPMEEFEVYGYVSSSDVKFLALIERGDVITVKKRKEIDIKMLLTAVHDAYVRHMMNPFSRIRGKIEPPCTDFEQGVQAAVDEYHKTIQKENNI